MTLGCGQRFGKIFANGVGGEAGPSGKKILFDGLDPSGHRRTEAGAMQKINELCFGFLVICAVGIMLVRRVVSWLFDSWLCRWGKVKMP